MQTQQGRPGGRAWPALQVAPFLGKAGGACSKENPALYSLLRDSYSWKSWKPPIRPSTGSLDYKSWNSHILKDGSVTLASFRTTLNAVSRGHQASMNRCCVASPAGAWPHQLVEEAGWCPARLFCLSRSSLFASEGGSDSDLPVTGAACCRHPKCWPCDRPWREGWWQAPGGTQAATYQLQSMCCQGWL